MTRLLTRVGVSKKRLEALVEEIPEDLHSIGTYVDGELQGCAFVETSEDRAILKAISTHEDANLEITALKLIIKAEDFGRAQGLEELWTVADKEYTHLKAHHLKFKEHVEGFDPESKVYVTRLTRGLVPEARIRIVSGKLNIYSPYDMNPYRERWQGVNQQNNVATIRVLKSPKELCYRVLKSPKVIRLQIDVSRTQNPNSFTTEGASLVFCDATSRYDERWEPVKVLELENGVYAITRSPIPKIRRIN
jgi:hypothetical protein